MLFRGINHVFLKVRNLSTSERFYSDALGFERVGERQGVVFYTAGGHHHDLALIEKGDSTTNPRPENTGLFHFCLDVPDEAALVEVYRRCQQAGVPILGSVDHIIMRSFYIHDPDGNVIEVGFDVPKEEWSNLANPYLVDQPYELPEKE